MAKWKYLVVTLRSDVNKPANAPKILNELGNQEWELVTVAAAYADSPAYFKRQKP